METDAQPRSRFNKRVTFGETETIYVENSKHYLDGLNRNLFHLCRCLFSFCILADAAWYFYSLESRSGYYLVLSIPKWLVSLFGILYVFFGIRLFINYKLEQTCLGMVMTYAVVAFIVRHPVGSGGLGDFPRKIHGEINFLQLFIYQGLIGGLLVMFGYTDMTERRMIMHGTKSYAVMLGRAMIALHFVFEVFYYKLYYYEERSKHLQSIERNPLVYLVVVGILIVIASYFAWQEISTSLRKLGALILGFMTIAVVAVELVKQPNAGHYPLVKFEAQVHYIIVQSGILIGCLLLYSVGSLKAQPYVKEAS